MNRIVVLLALLAFAGCDRAVEPEQSTEASRNPSAQSNDFVVVRIDGKDLTRGDVVRNGRAVLLLNMNKARKTKIKNRELKAMERYCKSAVNREIARAAVAKYVKDRNLQVPTNVLKRATRRFESQYGVLSRKLKRRHNLADLKYMLGRDAHYADDMIMELALYEVMTNNVVKSAEVVVTDAMVSERLEQIKKANAIAAATNACVFAKATNVWQKIVSKELTFEDAAAKFSEDEYINEGCEWGCFTRDQLEGDEAVLALLPTIKDGDITPPVESDGGLAILRKDEDDNDKTYSFSRVFFRLPYFYDVETPEQARAALRELKRVEQIRNAIQDNIAKLKIEYPAGTNIVWKLTQQDFK